MKLLTLFITTLLFPLHLFCYESALGELSGRRSAGSGITANGSYAGNFNIQWDVSYKESDSFNWHYVYSVSGGKALVNDFYLEIGRDLNLSDFLFNPHDTVSLINYNGNRYLLFDEVNSSAFKIEFYTDYGPVYGDVYALNGSNSAYNTGWNTEFLSGDATNWVVIAGNEAVEIPEPKTYLTLSSFLLLTLFIKRRRSVPLRSN